MNKELRIGDKVKVVSLSDECAMPQYLGKTGVITSAVPRADLDGGEDPDHMWNVLFNDQTTEQWWTEELEKI